MTLSEFPARGRELTALEIEDLMLRLAEDRSRLHPAPCAAHTVDLLRRLYASIMQPA